MVFTFIYNLIMGLIVNELYALVPKTCTYIIRWRMRYIIGDEALQEACEALEADIAKESSRLAMIRLTYNFLRQDKLREYPSIVSESKKEEDP